MKASFDTFCPLVILTFGYRLARQSARRLILSTLCALCRVLHWNAVLSGE